MEGNGFLDRGNKSLKIEKCLIFWGVSVVSWRLGINRCIVGDNVGKIS